MKQHCRGCALLQPGLPPMHVSKRSMQYDCVCCRLAMKEHRHLCLHLYTSQQPGLSCMPVHSDMRIMRLWSCLLQTGYENTGTSVSMFAARISWTWDFRGPCKAIDTGAVASCSIAVRACLSSKYAWPQA